jgi:uncharacterized membrane protein YfcA
MNPKSFIVIFFVGAINGCFVGFIGVGFSLLMAIMLAKLRLCMPSVLATLPVLLAFCCCLGTN